jgi:hypothetical protein
MWYPYISRDILRHIPPLRIWRFSLRIWRLDSMDFKG